MSRTEQGWFHRISSDDGHRTEGRDALGTNIAAGKALAEVIRTTLGPRGMDKMLVGASGTVIVTNDGARILEKMDIDHPVARLIVDVATEQKDRVNDGTTTTAMLTGELLGRAEVLLDRGVHQTSIIDGYRDAASRATEAMTDLVVEVDVDDRTRLVDVGRTAVTGKWDERTADALSGLAVDAVLAVADDGAAVHDNVVLQTVIGGSPGDSEFVEGVVIDMERSSTSLETFDARLPTRIEDARIAFVDDEMTVETSDAVSHLTFESPEGRRALLEHEDAVYADAVEHLSRVGADVVFCQKSIDDGLRSLLAREGVLALERTRQDEMHKLARSTGGALVMSTGELVEADVGRAGLVERRTVAGADLTVVSECPRSRQYSLVLRGGSEHVVEETKRVVESCIDVVALAVEERRLLAGGGATEVELARVLREHADSVEGREQLAIEAFADALESVPRTLAESAGLDPIDALVELHRRHHLGESGAGIDAVEGEVGEMASGGVLEPFLVKQRALAGAEEAARTILRVDDVVAAAPDADEGGHDHDHGGPGALQSTEGYPWTLGHSS
ncbi:thermosome subunit 1 [Halorarum salinum]|uniref:Thermosome subunit 1 n=2 Tax=Halorarum salinum TaxID=2743089 RepID=A0A7D5LCX8_9EURY|nr:thermosome subunit 1 [Halobaculum salinum]